LKIPVISLAGYGAAGIFHPEIIMTISVSALHPLFAGEVSGVDLRVPVEPDTFQEIARALDRYAVLVFPGQPLTDEQQIEFSARFGPLEVAVGSISKTRKSRLNQKLLADVSNLDESGGIRASSDPWRLMQLANQSWHTDSSFKRVPGKISLLSARELPPTGGETEFADLRAAYDALDVAVQEKIEGLLAEHSIFHSRSRLGYTDFTEEERAAFPPVPQTVVRVHPGSGRKTLYLASHASHIIGWPTPQGRALLDYLMEFSTQTRFVCRHHWRLHDLVVWDNRCTLHRARPYDDARHRRDMRRTTVQDSAATMDQVRTCWVAHD
jgi:alpha-ketoglutarate-dependent 2,4-dichlorophenoxyacetate dioxygenase